MGISNDHIEEDIYRYFKMPATNKIVSVAVLRQSSNNVEF
jgi:hypothetical protein